MIGVEYRTAAADVVRIVGPGVPRDLEHGVQPGPDPPGLRRGVRAALQLGRFLQGSLGHLLRQVGCLDPGPVVLFLRGRLAVQLGQLLADGSELLAEQELALLALHALADVVVDGLGDVQLGKLVARPASEPLQPLLRVDGLEQLLALFERQVRRVPRAVGQRGRIRYAGKGVNHLPGAALLQDRAGDAAVLTGQLGRAGAGRRLLQDGSLHPQRRAGPDGPGADTDAGDAADHRRRLAAGQPAYLLDDAEGADCRVLAVQPGDKQHAGQRVGSVRRRRRQPGCLDGRADLGARGIQRHHHGGQHDGVVERQHRHGEGFAHLSHFPGRLT